MSYLIVELKPFCTGKKHPFFFYRHIFWRSVLINVNKNVIFEFNSLLCVPEMTHLYDFFPLCQMCTIFDRSEYLHVSLVFGQFVDNPPTWFTKAFLLDKNSQFINKNITI